MANQTLQDNPQAFVAALQGSSTEEEVKGTYAQFFGIRYNTSDRLDLYTEQVLFEFKFDKDFGSANARAATLAQTLYYVRELKFGSHIDKPIPPTLCLADRSTVVLTDTAVWKPFYTCDDYDWDLAPSSPDSRLCEALAESPQLRALHVYEVLSTVELTVFAEQLRRRLAGQMAFDFADKKVITEANFEEVFDYWNKIFGDAVRNGFKTSRYFVSDIQEGNTLFVPAQSLAVFRVGQTGELKEKRILPRDYEHFWSLYEKVRDANTVRAILAKIDRLTDDTMRRFHGEFFTPLPFARKALGYIEQALGKAWWQTGEYRLWDMAAGTGNLEYYLPQDALQYCYLSTLYHEDAEHLTRLFPDANVFQYDYLNDDVGNVFANGSLNFKVTWKLPAALRKDLKNPDIKWIILINPPFATAGEALSKGANKEKVAETEVREMMHEANLGEVSRELFSQFIYRIKFEFAGKNAHLALFSKLKYLNANNDQNFRDKVFDFGFRRGFVFSSVNFHGTSRSSQFPVGMLIWNVGAKKSLDRQHIRLDIFNERVEKIGIKHVPIIHKEQHLNKWIKRPPTTRKFPPLSSAIVVAAKNKDRRDRVAEKFLASFRCVANDFQNQNLVFFLSAPAVSAGALSVTPANFEQAMVVHAARRVPQATWLNDRDQFLRPEREPSAEFVADCTVWNLFAGSNQTAALRNVQYEGETYQIHNHFFPFTVAEIRRWTVADKDVALQLTTAEDRYVATWLHARIKARELSNEAVAVLNAGREIYRFYFAHLNELRTPKFRIETWDAGWWQIRMALADADELGKDLFAQLKVAHEALRRRILPQLAELGIVISD